MPELPGMSEAGLPAYNLSFWYGLFLPAGTPPATVKSLFDAASKAVQQPEVKGALLKEGTEVLLSRSPEDFAAFLEEDSKFWAQLVKQAGITID
jgi:tripartite-type tricarboxylate transporter receptor subunit TctC